MTSTSINVGLTGARNSSNVMKPPGGECHDLFGADFNGTPSHQRVLKPPGGGTSDLFAAGPDQADSPRKVRAPASSPLGDTSPIVENDVPVINHGNDSHSRLFGPPEPVMAKRAMQSSNIFGINETAPNPASKKPTLAQVAAPVEVDGKIAEVSEQEKTNNAKVSETAAQLSRGNPVTGEGYESPKSNGNGPQLNGNNNILRNRVPPGGFSSGLW